MLALKPGDLLRIDYTGRVARSGRVFDTTMEEVAKKSGIYSPEVPYSPRLVVYGAGNMLAGLEELLPTIEAGKKHELVISCEKAFGKRSKDMLRILLLSDFRRQNVRPQVGMSISLNGAPGIVKSINSGRVMVDFNHPLSGEDLHYSVTVLEVIGDDRKKLEAILSAAKIDAKVIPSGDSFDIEFSKENPSAQEVALAQAAIRSLSPNAQIKMKENETPERRTAETESPEKLHSKLAAKKVLKKVEPIKKK